MYHGKGFYKTAREFTLHHSTKPMVQLELRYVDGQAQAQYIAFSGGDKAHETNAKRYEFCVESFTKGRLNFRAPSKKEYTKWLDTLTARAYSHTVMLD